MKAVRIHAYGGIEQLQYEDAPTPEPGPGEVLVKVTSTSVNPIDLKMRSGEARARFPVTFPGVLGRDVAGEVVKVGSEVSKFKAGDKVMGLVTQSYAEFLTAKADVLTHIPEGLEIREAGAYPLVVTTGNQLAEHLSPQAGDRILITGALGSVGRTAVYVAKQQGAHVIAGVRGRQKLEAASLEADQIIAIDDDGEIASISSGLDAIGDTVAGDIIAKLIPKLKPGGVVGSVLGKPKAAEGKNIRVEAFTAQPDSPGLHQLARDLRDKRFTIPIARSFPLADAAKAQELVEKGNASGKIMLIP